MAEYLGVHFLVAGVSFAVTVLAGRLLIPFLRKLKFGQTIKEIGPSWHMSKQGTPTMGGFMFMIGITAAVLIAEAFSRFASFYYIGTHYGHLYILLLAWLFGAIGFVDDYFKVVRKQNEGLTALQKLALQAAVGVAFLALLRYTGYLTPSLYIPFFDAVWELSWIVYLVIGIFVVVGMVNAVNLTDGIDGLCAGITLPIAVFFAAAAAHLLYPMYKALKAFDLEPSMFEFLIEVKPLIAPVEVALLSAALAGGMLGFLIFNFHPAKVFMGDTGSLFLGGLICGIAFACNSPVLMVIVGAVFVLEMFSVILQVGYFKMTNGKRLFKMSPLHHHFEKSGWSEVKIFTVFVSVTVTLCAVSYFFM